MATSPTQLTLKNLRERGYIAQVVEKWNPHARKRQDLFGIIDVLGVGNGETIAVQCTSRGHISDRINKIKETKVIQELRDAEWRVEVHGWDKPKHRWRLKVVDIS